MIKRVFLSLFLMTYVSSLQALTYEQLKEKSVRYIAVLNLAGRLDAKGLADELPKIVTNNCHKVINGKTMTTDIVQLKFQLEELINMAGVFTVEALDVLPSPQDSASVVRYILSSTYKGKYTTIAILHFNEDGVITEINEVNNRFED